MPLNVLVSPGCAAVSDDYLDRVRGAGGIVIDAGEIFKALTGSAEIPSGNVPALRLALGLRTTAIRFARENDLAGVVRTGDGSRTAIRRLQAEAGGGVQVLHLDREVACRRVESLIASKDRQAACKQGLDRFYTRYVPDPEDEVVK